MYYKWINSPLGPLLLTAHQHALTGLYLKEQKYFPQQIAHWQESDHSDPLNLAEKQLDEYFAHQRQQFDFPLDPAGSDFQKQVWQHLRQIPFGQTISYGALASWMGQPQAARAVGAANGRNPISIIVPCHRVIASNGKLIGYAGGIDRKQWLLQHEQASHQGKLEYS
jgi:methylated-DNA-[protein]-cysteine S-methyltransferase